MLLQKLGSADIGLHGGPKCRYNLHSSAHNIVVTMGGGIADEDKHDIDDHNDLDETQMIELNSIMDFITLTFVSCWLDTS